MKRRGFILLCVIILVAVGYNKIGVLYPMEHFDTVKKYSDEYGVDPLLSMSVIKAESNFKADATSHKSAAGLMQLTGETARWCAEKLGIEYTDDMLYDTDFNIRAGVFYLSFLLEKYGGDITAAAASYNAGMGNVDKWLKNSEYSGDGATLNKTPFNETSTYINKIKFNYKIYGLLYGGKEGKDKK